MLNYSPLYPVTNAIRSSVSLDGMWRFQFDPESVGQTDNWMKTGLPSPISIPVPASFSDLFTTAEERDYCGDFWYETDFYVHSAPTQNVFVRFGSITHRAHVFCNGIEVACHEGGFLPVVADVTKAIIPGGKNRLSVLVNNELSETSLPCGMVTTLPNGRKLVKPYFDFYNYSGIHRSVYLVSVPTSSIKDYTVDFALSGKDAFVNYTVTLDSVPANADIDVLVSLIDKEGNTVAAEHGTAAQLKVENAHLWRVRNAYLYTLKIQLFDQGSLLDEYSDRIGIRTVAIKDCKFYINDEQVYLKGFGKHEDFEIIGRGFNAPVMKRDFECMKWMNANCFRTSHYPYSEEWYRMADEEGFLIIDEIPGVGMMRSIVNFAVAGTGVYTAFFEADTVPALKANHMHQMEELIARDKNHPSVFSWSIFNEPETTSPSSYDYFSDIFALARSLDVQKRPLTGALEKNSSPALCKCCVLCDFVCLNRYYGWYILGGPEMDAAMIQFHQELKAWQERGLNVPFVFTEFGTDTLASEHRLPSVMWSQEYQNDYFQKYYDIFDQYDFIQGELLWNFADFQTSEGIRRVIGNKKGIFTRTRQPKDAAFLTRNRWMNL